MTALFGSNNKILRFRKNKYSSQIIEFDPFECIS